MIESDTVLPQSVTNITLDGKEIFLVATAHVSKQSVEDVRETIETVKPDCVCVELCQARYETMVKKDTWKKMNIFKIIKEKKSVVLLAQLIMSSFYRRLGEKLGVQPGEEMLEAIEQADKNGASLVLADRDIQITLKRLWRSLGFWTKMKMFSSLLYDVIVEEEKIDEEMIEKIKKTDQLETMMASFTKTFPQIKSCLIDERDIYLSQKIRQAKGSKIVAVVGAGHVVGIAEQIKEEQSLVQLMEIPPKSIIPTILKWVIPAAIVILLVVGFIKGGAAHSVESIYIWILVNGICSAIGAAIALAHPLTVIAAFLAAPLTSLNPFLAAGWVAGLVQAFVRRPQVADFEDLPEAIASVKGFWSNPVTKILLVVVLANIGSTLGTIVAGSWIGSRTF